VDIVWPRGIEVTQVQSAVMMHQASMDLWPGMDMACCAAAVADFRPVSIQGKFKKKSAASGMSLQFEPNPDILAEMGAVKSGAQFLMGFCAEAEDPCTAMAEKLKAKNLDMIVGNRIDLPSQGFGGRENQVHILDSSGRRNTLPQRPKTDIAWDIWQWATGL
jgi:phosphopantothenoylcysteine decarboxylase/phosphopantothenate--cysteine ligase